MDDQGTQFGVDRLLPRHAAGASLEIEWNTAMHKRRFRAPYKNSAPAVIRELSLAGALIDAPVPPEIKIGDRIEIGGTNVTFCQVDEAMEDAMSDPGAFRMLGELKVPERENPEQEDGDGTDWTESQSVSGST